jgi:uncharacterized membrane-anchored protein
MRSYIALAACAVSLVLVNVSIAGKERLLRDGKVVYLELAPLDPRSLMQGDYMALRFRLADSVARSSAADGHIVATLDSRGIATFRRLHDGKPLESSEVLLRYRLRDGQLKFATNAFFFEEGSGARYEQARYGEFRVARDGELLLTGLRGKDLRKL